MHALILPFMAGMVLIPPFVTYKSIHNFKKKNKKAGLVWGAIAVPMWYMGYPWIKAGISSASRVAGLGEVPAGAVPIPPATAAKLMTSQQVKAHEDIGAYYNSIYKKVMVERMDDSDPMADVKRRRNIVQKANLAYPAVSARWKNLDQRLEAMQKQFEAQIKKRDEIKATLNKPAVTTSSTPTQPAEDKILGMDKTTAMIAGGAAALLAVVALK